MKFAALFVLLSVLMPSTLAKDPAGKCSEGKTQYSCSSIKKAKRAFFCSSRKYSKKSIERTCQRSFKKALKKK